MQNLSIKYGSVQGILSVEATLSRGVSPSRFILRIRPQDGLSPEPATLTISDGENTVSFPDVAPNIAHLRKETTEKGMRWSLPLVDRRRRWTGGRVQADFNERLPDGTIKAGAKKNAQEIAAFMLNIIGESGYDIIQVPTGVYPRIEWEDKPYPLALKEFCDSVNCIPVLGLDNRIKIARRGAGASLPSSGTILPPWRFTPPKPTRLVVAGSPSWWQTLLALRPVAHKTNGDLCRLTNTDFWVAGEFPMFFPNISSADRHLASTHAYRWFQVYQQAEGGLDIGTCPEPINDIRQIYPIHGKLLEVGKDLELNDVVQREATLRGTYWPWCDHPYNTDPGTECPVKFEVLDRDGLVRTDIPVIQWEDSGETPAAPDLYLLASYQVRKFNDGSYVRLTRSRNLGGPGGDVAIYRPELFETRAHQYDGVNVSGHVDNLGVVNPEADAYLDAFATRYSNTTQEDFQYPGIKPIALDGRVEQVRWLVRMGHGGTTRASTMHEFDLFTPSEVERASLSTGALQ